VEVRVGQPAHQPASTAAAARFLIPALAEDQLGQPERQALLAHPDRPGDQDDLGQPVRPDGVSQAEPGVLMSDQGRQRHGMEGKKGTEKRYL
jgi:hypothetical protein